MQLRSIASVRSIVLNIYEYFPMFSPKFVIKPNPYITLDAKLVVITNIARKVNLNSIKGFYLKNKY